MIIATISATALLIASIGCISAIVIPKLRILSAINVESLPIERHEQTKDKIIYQRLRRRLYGFSSFLGFALKPIGDFFSQFFGSIAKAYQRLVDSREYAKKQWFHARQEHQEQDGEQNVEERITKHIERAEEFLNNEDYERAEAQYIDALSLDAKRIEPYRGLARLYAIQKEWRKSTEVLLFLMKLYRECLKFESEKESTQLSCDCADDASLLAEMYYALNDFEQAAKSMRKAVRLQPLNPKYLDQSLEIMIQLGQKFKAEKLLDALRKTNPDNQKIAEFEERLHKLTY